MPAIPSPLLYGTGAVLALALAGWSSADALSRSARASAPEFARKVAPWNAASLGTQGAAVLMRTEDPTASRRARAIAAAAIRRGDLSASTLRTAALAESAVGNGDRAARLIGLAQRLSRRDLLTQIWYIEHYSAAGDVRRTLDHYEIALTTSRSALQLLYPVLVGAAADPALTPEIGKFMLRNRGRPWWQPMMGALIGESTDPRAAAQIARIALKPGPGEDRALVKTAIARLVAVQAFDEASRLYAGMARGNAKAPDSVGDGGFERDPALPPFDWELAEDGNVRSQRGPAPAGREGNVLWIDADGGVRTVVVSQLLKLAPGAHQLSAVVGATGDGEDSHLLFAMRCAVGESADQLIDVTPSASAVRTVRGSYTVPAGCAWQRLSVQVSGAHVGTWIDDIRLR
ncbi:hypothetical protein Q9Q95_17310 [Sphingomonas sp. DG1-23]|uniref:hypothetical protein n=1 Tax=Sphingomonas sp. DG1-23 TaxID=3068316 RepID=UPI00273EFB58|nr:hypothetical protein [Sphingomonas sp. DG1-23]MDP5280688.1 hypothetical protein [Sphingomonas sp. DG1-23]